MYPSQRHTTCFNLFLLSVFLWTTNAIAQDSISGRPRIGVTLSGGGAKGLAHIGILKAIDSAGLKVDYISGTSMGSIIGSLYAIGYSATDIEKAARKIDWDILLSNQSSLRSLLIEEKSEYGKYAVELPWQDHFFRLPTGVLEAEELWLKFAEMYFPVYNIKDFGRFSIPFRCIAADISNGDAVALDSGEIITAIRASMAIPSLFTSVNYQGRKLIDGGVVRNFPVRDVRYMGADYVIGSNVALGLLPKEKVNNALQVLMQIAFFKEAEDNREEVPLCDIYIPMPIENYHAASFNKAEELLELGLREGRKIYPQLRQLVDSLDRIYGSQPAISNRLPKVDSVRITDYEVIGLEKTTEDFFLHMMQYLDDRYYTPAKLTKMVRTVFGTRYYSKIVYSLQPLADGSAKIIFEVEENPVSFAKLGLHYNKFTGISVITNLTTRNFFTPHSRSLATLNIGESFRARGEHLQYLGRAKNIAMLLGIQYDNFNVTTYEDFRKDGLYKMDLFQAEARMQVSANRKFTTGIGTRFNWMWYRPSIQSALDISGKNEFVSGFTYLAINTLDKNVLPRRGWKIDGEFSHIFNQSPAVTFFAEGVPIGNLDSFGISYNNYQRVLLNAEAYAPLSSKVTLFTLMQGGINLNYEQNFLNDFMIGGLTKQFRNQITFAGLEEGSVYSASIASLLLGLRVELFNNVYISAQSNVLASNFYGSGNIFQQTRLLSGHALTFAYNFALGPLEVSLMYCDQSKQVKSYFNLGIPF